MAWEWVSPVVSGVVGLGGLTFGWRIAAGGRRREVAQWHRERRAPHKPGLRRAARFNGAMPTFDSQRSSNVPIEWFTQAASFMQQLAPGGLDIALEGATDGPSAAQRIAPYADAGMTWWIEALGWWRGDRHAATSRITAGPPTKHNSLPDQQSVDPTATPSTGIDNSSGERGFGYRAVQGADSASIVIRGCAALGRGTGHLNDSC
jgi:hypothetical protein